MKGTLSRTAFVLALCGLGSVANAQSYSYFLVDVPAEVGTGTNLVDINDEGVMVGDYYAVGTECNVGFVSRGGEFNTVTHPNAECSTNWKMTTMVSGINNAGDIVGLYWSKTRTNMDGLPLLLGFMRKGDAFTDVEYPESYETQAIGIDDRGRIVGWYTRLDDPMHWPHGFLLDNSGFHSVDYPGAMSTYLYDINARGQVVGSYIDENYYEHGLIYTHGAFAPLDYPAVIITQPWDISMTGRVVGYAVGEVCTNYVCGFVWQRGAFELLSYPDPKAIETMPFGINARGVIVGRFTDENYAWHGFMAMPD